MGMCQSLQQQLAGCLTEHFRVSSVNELPRDSKQVQHALRLLDPRIVYNNNMVDVAPFLLATTPIPLELAQHILWQTGDQENRSSANQQRNSLVRLPTVVEWDYAARGGGWEILFPYECCIVEPRARPSNELGPRNALGLRQVAVWPELCTSDNSSSHGEYHHPSFDQQKRVLRGGEDMWSLIYHSIPTTTSLDVCSEMDESDDAGEVVRLAMGIFPQRF